MVRESLWGRNDKDCWGKIAFRQRDFVQVWNVDKVCLVFLSTLPCPHLEQIHPFLSLKYFRQRRG